MSSANVVTANVTADVVTANYFVGNGAFLSGISKDLPRVANIDIKGNVVGTNVSGYAINADRVSASNVFANVVTVGRVSAYAINAERASANVVTVGHVSASNVSANVVTAGRFIGDGSGLTGVNGFKVGYYYKPFAYEGIINTSSVTTQNNVYVLGKNKTYIIKVCALCYYPGQTYGLTNIPCIRGTGTVYPIPCVAHVVTDGDEVTFEVTSDDQYFQMSRVEITEYSCV